MGPKQAVKESKGSKKGKQQVVEEPEVVEPEPEPEPEILDPYQDLRYVPTPTPPPWQPATRKFIQIPVFKRRPLPSISDPKNDQPKGLGLSEQTLRARGEKRDSSDQHWKRDFIFCEKDGKQQEGLVEEMIVPKMMSAWIFPGQLPTTPPPYQILRRRQIVGNVEGRNLEHSLRKESKCLELTAKIAKEQLRVENMLMAKTGKDRQNLLVRRDQFLPRIGELPREKSVVEMERTVTPKPFPAPTFFDESFRLARARNGITATLTRRERGFNVVTDWLGCPEVTNDIMRILGLSAQSENESNRQRACSKEGENVLPFFPRLGVVATHYEKAQREISAAVRSDISNGEDVLRKPTVTLHTTSSKTVRESEHAKMEDRTFAPKSSSRQRPPSSVGLAFGNISLHDSLDPARAKRKWVIEIGCTAELGENAVGSVFMKNTGTTVVHFNWVKEPRQDVFGLCRYKIERFVFDSWGGSILPGETFRIPFLYKSTESGYYSEDWRLLTRPVLENHAKIILRFWGITRQYDPYFLVREGIDEMLKIRMSRNICQHRTDKIIDFLPLKEVPLKDSRFPIAHLGPDLFHLNNPWLKYNSAAVFRLAKLKEILDTRRKRRQTKTDILSSTPDMDNGGTGSSSSSKLKAVPQSVHRPSEHHSTSSSILQLPDNLGEEEEDMVPPPVSPTSHAPSLVDLKGTGSKVVAQAIKMIQRQINPDDSALRAVEDDVRGDGEDITEEEAVAHARRAHAAANLVNPDIMVNSLREAIIRDSESLEVQEALFDVFSSQVTRLLFRTDLPAENWKSTVCWTLLYHAMDSFSDFATSLKGACCDGRKIQLLQAKKAEEETLAAKSFSDASDASEGVSPISQLKADIVTKTETPAQDEESSPRKQTSSDSLEQEPNRFQDQYYSRLHTYMYQLLSDVMDSMDNLLAEKKVLNLDYSEMGFTRVRHVPMDVDLGNRLLAPLPPSWVTIAQRMDQTVAAIRRHRLEVEEADQRITKQ